jgi:type I phosphodiesterase/nucleotide pyrophosphatase
MRVSGGGAAILLVVACGRSASAPRTAPLPPAAPLAAEASARPPEAEEPRVVLVTIDGVRWQDVFEGVDRSLARRSGKGSEEPTLAEQGLERPESLLPRLYDLVAKSGIAIGHGAGCGIVRTAGATNLSLPSYYELFTARRTRCTSNFCAPLEVPTLLDRAAEAGVTPVASIGSWDALERAVSRGTATVFVSAGTRRWSGRRPLEDARLESAVAEGEKAGPFPASHGMYRPDRHTAAIALEYVRAHRPRLLHVGLGDADEFGHRNDYRMYLAALHASDAFVGQLGDLLDTLGLSTSTTVIVVADHGRAHTFREHGPVYPESGRSFVFAFGGRVAPRGKVCARRDITLPDVGATVQALLGLPPDEAPDAGRAIEELDPKGRER